MHNIHEMPSFPHSVTKKVEEKIEEKIMLIHDNGIRDDDFHTWDDANNMIDHTFDLNKLLCDVGYVPNPVLIHFCEPVYLFTQKKDVEIKINLLQPIWDTRVPSCANPMTSSNDATTPTAIFLLSIHK